MFWTSNSYSYFYRMFWNELSVTQIPTDKTIDILTDIGSKI